jgi:hypothetical protein
MTRFNEKSKENYSLKKNQKKMTRFNEKSKENYKV